MPSASWSPISAGACCRVPPMPKPDTAVADPRARQPAKRPARPRRATRVKKVKETAASYFDASAPGIRTPWPRTGTPNGVEDIVPLGVFRGPDAVRALFREMFAAMPDMEFTVSRITADDEVAAVAVARGGHVHGRALPGHRAHGAGGSSCAARTASRSTRTASSPATPPSTTAPRSPAGSGCCRPRTAAPSARCGRRSTRSPRYARPRAQRDDRPRHAHLRPRRVDHRVGVRDQGVRRLHLHGRDHRHCGGCAHSPAVREDVLDGRPPGPASAEHTFLESVACDSDRLGLLVHASRGPRPGRLCRRRARQHRARGDTLTVYGAMPEHGVSAAAGRAALPGARRALARRGRPRRRPARSGWSSSRRHAPATRSGTPGQVETNAERAVDDAGGDRVPRRAGPRWLGGLAAGDQPGGTAAGLAGRRAHEPHAVPSGAPASGPRALLPRGRAELRAPGAERLAAGGRDAAR